MPAFFMHVEYGAWFSAHYSRIATNAAVPYNAEKRKAEVWKAEMQFGFSIVGVVFLLMLFVPNIRWAKSQPIGYDELQKHEDKTLLVFERIGQVATTCSAVVFVCPRGFSFPWLLWLVATFLLMVLYEAAWIRYFRDGEKLDGMYQPLGPVPVPIASLPVAAFVLLGIWYQSPVCIIAAAVLGVGHIGIHLGHLRELQAR